MNFDKSCDAAHGLSLLLEARIGDSKRFCLLDAGPNPPVWADNVAKLGIDVSRIEHFVLSHYHIDHSGGMRSAVPLIAKARAGAGLSKLVVDLHPDWPEERGTQFMKPDGSYRYSELAPSNPGFAEVESMGGEVHTSSEGHTILGGTLFVSGEIERVTPYETGLPGHASKRNGEWKEDPEIMDER